jgi:hypothetical protein
MFHDRCGGGSLCEDEFKEEQDNCRDGARRLKDESEKKMGAKKGSSLGGEKGVITDFVIRAAPDVALCAPY